MTKKLLVGFSFIIANCLTIFAQTSAKSLIDKFFSDYETKGAEIAVDEIYKTNVWASRIQDNVNDIKNKLANFNEELVGKYYG